MNESWLPYREPLATTLVRNAVLALLIGGVVAWRLGRMPLWPAAAGLALWFTLGGHCVEIWFLNWLRPRIAPSRRAQLATRLAVWFAGGVILGLCVFATMRLTGMTHAIPVRRWWIAGVVFIGVELGAHLGLAASRRPNFYDGAG
jgi:hypothetical protein